MGRCLLLTCIGALVMMISAQAQDRPAPPGRPPALGVQANIVFLYYKYDYLVSKGVHVRGPVGDATRHPTRGFVAYDPESYFFEFETFVDHPQNAALRRARGK
jgi:hypothetical protein